MPDRRRGSLAVAPERCRRSPEQFRVRDTYTRARGHPESVPLLRKTEAPS